ncbi:hypothetical protein E4K72_18915 [Oxalobacteraceae bacterium OM1]|nr:hypothetical protein E4K72_18915 [Oxalobacteraceae bacterium OM1]
MKSIVATLFAVPLLSLSAVTFAAEPASDGPMTLSAEQMDNLTAGKGRPWWTAFTPGQMAHSSAVVTQVNTAPVTIVQIGNNNTAIVISGNFSWIRQ